MGLSKKAVIERFVVASDLHGDCGNQDAVDCLLDFIKFFKPDMKFFAGDLCDFRALRMQATESERKDRIMEDFYQGTQLLQKFKPHVFLRGNHDERLWAESRRLNGISSEWALSGTEEIEKECKRLHVQMLPYHHKYGVYNYNELLVMHGCYAGIGCGRKYVYAYGKPVIHAHTHTLEETSVEGLESNRVCYDCGCLCNLDMEYTFAKQGVSRWENGFRVGLMFDDGSFEIGKVRKIKDTWISTIPSIVL